MWVFMWEYTEETYRLKSLSFQIVQVKIIHPVFIVYF